MADLSKLDINQLQAELEQLDEQITAINADKRRIAAELSRRRSTDQAAVLLDTLSPEQRDAVVRLATAQMQAAPTAATTAATNA